MEYIFTTPNGTEILVNMSFCYAFFFGMIFTMVQDVILSFAQWMLEKARYWRYRCKNG